MRLFLDSANLGEVRDIASWGVLSGVTTTPTSCAAEGVDVATRVQEIGHLVAGPVTATIGARGRDEFVHLGKELASISENVVVQFAVGADTLAACRILSEAGVRIGMIHVFSAAQAVLAANAGAAYCSPSIGRVDDLGADGVALLEEIAQIFAVQGYPTELVAMGLTSPNQVVAAARAGADVSAIPYDVFRQMVSNPLTDLSAERFSEDWAQVPQPFEPAGFKPTAAIPNPEPAQPLGYGYEDSPPPQYVDPYGSVRVADVETPRYDGGFGVPPPS
ncbi:MAG: fructose-6-phosphate aldolase [Acidimicrobiia bacterium]|nr:fructose-6-phosphate aldolase [Acidimicrobiia bacterium]